LFDSEFVRPYVVTAYLLSKFGSLSNDDFSFLVPFVTNAEKLAQVIDAISAVRAGTTKIETFILDTLMAMVSEELILKIGMHRKSGEKGEKQYDKAYFPLYVALKT